MKFHKNSFKKRWEFLGTFLSILSLFFACFLGNFSPVQADTPAIQGLGPGGLIHGADISIWQHQNGAKVDFAGMYASGIRFIYFKGSDSIPKYDKQVFSYLADDRNQAQANGIYTGIYHYATLPNTGENIKIILDALKQSRAVYNRIRYLGGLNNMDLPPVLDLESNCIAADSSGNCTARMNQKDVTTWTLTFLRNLSRLTNKTAILNTFPTFMQNNMKRDISLSQFPLWVAQYGASPEDSSRQPGALSVGCYVTSWTGSDCKTHWSIWQYTSCGIGNKHGLPNGRMDLNVFYGSNEDFQNLISNNWQSGINQTNFDFLPFDQLTTANIDSVTVSDTNHPVLITATILRPDNSPVLTGKVFFKNASSTNPSGTSTFTRNPNGDWVLKISGLTAGSYIGTLEYEDPSQVAQNASLPVSFNLLFAPKPPKKPAAPTPPYNYCDNQFKD